MTSAMQSLPIVVLYPHSRCNCRCLMCDIWKQTDRQEVSPEQFERYLEDFQKLSVKWVVLSGGEPLMHSNLFPLCARLKDLRIRTTILSSGPLLKRYAAQIIECIDDVIVSLDGPPLIHDQIRGVRGASVALSYGVTAVLRLRPKFPIAARSTVQRENFRYLRATAHTAKALGLRSISYLAADLTSTAFHRPDGWPADRQSAVALTEPDLPVLDSEIEALLDEWRDDPFLADSPDKLRRIARHFRAHLGLCPPQAPSCNAPWVSTVIETDGTLRPCFFHEAVGNARSGLESALNSPAALAFRSGLNVEANPTCRRCVCSLNWSGQ